MNLFFPHCAIAIMLMLLAPCSDYPVSTMHCTPDLGMQLEVMWHKSPVMSTAPNYRPLQTAIGTTCRVRPIFPIGYRPLLTSTGWYLYWPIIL